MASYGPHDSNRTEGIAMTLFVLGLVLWVGGLAYAAPGLQVILVIVGAAGDVGAMALLCMAKIAGERERNPEPAGDAE